MGRVVKPHGLRGEVVVELWTDRLERLAVGSTLSADAATLRVTGSRPQGRRHLVRFDGVEDLEAAEQLREVVLRAPALDDPSVLWIHDLVGTEVVDRAGRILGRVASVEANPASDLLVLDGGGLVPLRFVVDHRPGVQVTVDPPEGLLG